MVMPNLIHAVPIEISLNVRTTTVYDEDAREPVQQTDRSVPVVIPGVPNWMGTNGGDNYTPNKGGFISDAVGYILFRYKDLDAAGIDLKHNDRFTKIGSRPYDLYIVKIQPCGHYTDQGGPTLVKAHFSDREPSKVLPQNRTVP